jgi:FtsP/CotA-like multicopper oxidase with cupredoxin domain
LLAAASAVPVSGAVVPKSTQEVELSGTEFDLHIGYQKVNFTGKECIATTVNGSLPGPTLRWKEGETVTLRVTNHLQVPTSIHWHGIVLPSTMDGAPGFDFEAIAPGATFVYRFEVKQSGTYWYHSHSGMQEQIGLLGAIIIDPKEPSSVAYDREHLVLLSDWSDEAPHQVYAKLKKRSDYYNYRERTVGDWWGDVKRFSLVGSWNVRSMWNDMRMSDRDIADVTGATYSYLMNGKTSNAEWLGEFVAGEAVRLRIVNGAAMTIFDLRIPGLRMTVVAADGQDIQPVEVDEFRLAPAETYDIIIKPAANRAYCLFAQTIDRSGFVWGRLTADKNLPVDVPEMDRPPILGHEDMGMDMGSMSGMAAETPAPAVDHSAHQTPTTPKGQDVSAAHAGHDMGAMDHAAMNHGDMDHSTMDHGNMDHSTHTMAGMDMTLAPSAAMSTPQKPLALAGFGSNFPPKDGTEVKVTHASSEFGAQVDMHSQSPQSGLSDPGLGLREHQQKYNRKVLTYADLRSLLPTRDKRQPTREIELHLTGNMHRYIWTINGIGFMRAAPIELAFGERVRIILVNDTMMTHPIHLHGMWSELETGDPDFIPRKHTVIVQPGAKISYLVTADAKGNWAYHCHMMYHMLGMMRTVRVV